MPYGQKRWADVAGPPSPEKPGSPVPANMVSIPLMSIRSIAPNVVSHCDTYRLPAASMARPLRPVPRRCASSARNGAGGETAASVVDAGAADGVAVALAVPPGAAAMGAAVTVGVDVVAEGLHAATASTSSIAAPKRGPIRRTGRSMARPLWGQRPVERCLAPMDSDAGRPSISASWVGLELSAALHARRASSPREPRWVVSARSPTELEGVHDGHPSSEDGGPCGRVLPLDVDEEGLPTAAVEEDVSLAVAAAGHRRQVPTHGWVPVRPQTR